MSENAPETDSRFKVEEIDEYANRIIDLEADVVCYLVSSFSGAGIFCIPMKELGAAARDSLRRTAKGKS